MSVTDNVSKAYGAAHLKPLADPLMTFGRCLRFAGVASALSFVIFLGVSAMTGKIVFLAVSIASLISLPNLVFFHLLAVPPIRTNVLCLRSFNSDGNAGRLRSHLTIAFGSGFRVSGIRNPRKRLPLFLKPVLASMMAVQYSRGAFLDLEAESDWAARLWVSMGECRALVVDLREITGAVATEIQIALTCMNRARILFIADESRTLAQWNEMISGYGAARETDSSGDFQILVWCDEERATRRFVEAAAAFAKSLPVGTNGSYQEGFALVRDQIATRAQVWGSRASAWLQITVGIALLGSVVLYDPGGNSFAGIVITLLLGLLSLYVWIGLLTALLSRRRFIALARRLNPPFAAETQTRFNSLKWMGLFSLGSLAAVLTIAMTSATAQVDLAKQQVATQTVRALETEVMLYNLDHAKYPDSLKELENGRSNPQYRPMRPDPWGQRYVYEVNVDHTAFRIISSGPDRTVGTADDIVGEQTLETSAPAK